MAVCDVEGVRANRKCYDVKQLHHVGSSSPDQSVVQGAMAHWGLAPTRSPCLRAVEDCVFWLQLCPGTCKHASACRVMQAWTHYMRCGPLVDHMVHLDQHTRS
jgi:hypothetical protein